MSAALDLFPLPRMSEDARLAAVQRYDILDTPREPAFDRIASLIRMVFGVETSVVSIMDAHRQWYKASEGTPHCEVPIGETFCRYAMDGTEPLVVPDATEDERFRDSPHVTAPSGVRFYASVPLTTADGFNVGTICAIDSRPRQFSEREVTILRQLAQIAVDELELRRLATTDGLTGISTRRAFREDAEKYLSHSRRHRTQLSALTFDIDRFKTINDTYGHAAGDAVLKAVAKATGSLLRQSDIFGRLGGEEFAVVVPDTDPAAAMAVAEKLRHAILDLHFPGSRPALTVSASFGIATFDPGQDDYDSLMLKADEALYEAKGSGRNKCLPWRGTTLATTRQVERRRVLKSGKLVFNDRRSVIDCTVRALWENGAEVLLTSSADVPDMLTLEVPSSNARWEAKVDIRRPNSLELSLA